MKLLLIQGFMSLALMTIVAVAPAGATLIDRGNGLIYDDHLDVTWLQNANLAATNQFGLTQSAGETPGAGEIGSTGLMSWYTANNWIAGMNAANYKGLNNWRLPTTTQPDTSCGHQFAFGGFPDQGFGYGCLGSEMVHLFTVEGITSAVPGVFDNVQANNYWSGTELSPNPNGAWIFKFNGAQLFGDKRLMFFGWAMRSGDVSVPPVPEPSTMLLLGTGLAGLVAWRRKKVV